MNILKKVLAILAVAIVVLSPALFARAASTERVIHTFQGTDGGGPDSDLIFDDAGNLYGTTHGGSGSRLLGTVFELTPDAKGRWTEKVLHTFHGSDGWQPLAGLVRDTTGNLYGTTSLGGSFGNGTVFELTPGSNGHWSEKVLHNFNGKDGNYPSASLILDAAGNLYGTAQFGGAGTGCCGVVFEVSPGAKGKWTEKVLYSFKGKDGRLPYAGLILDKAGALYGTTQLGGTATACPDGCGLAFKLLPKTKGQWSETVLHNFGNGADGSGPAASLIFDAEGNLYGTTVNGGAYTYGAVVELMPQGNGHWTHKVLHSFNNDGKDGRYPQGALIFDNAGNLYGTTAYGGAGTGCTAQFGLCGTVFELTPATKGKWTETILHSFVGDGKDGVGPVAGVAFDKTGTLYGTTSAGGAGLGLYGAVFEVTP